MKLTLGLLAILVLLAALVWVISRIGKKENKKSGNIAPGERLPTNQPDWAKNAVIYEVNVRQYTQEGTFSAFSNHIDRLKDLGVDILWFMPVFPISEKNKKGELGSYYAVSDYKEIKTEFGTKEAFDQMVEKIHNAGMKIILDWVPNHTGWDHIWLESNKSYYTRDAAGNVMDPIDPETGEPWGWTDVADLNYDNREMRNEMIKYMQYWLDNHNIDGFRVDVAHNVPNDFWDQVRDSFSKNEYPFMLAEGDVAYQRNSGTFAMDYGWTLHHLLNKIAKGEKPASAIDDWLEENRKKYHRGYHMHFITNHDENAWNGTEYERMGEGVDTFAVLTFTLDGMPLIYSGQESAYDKRIEFFKKDPIDWGTYEKTEFYKKLIDLKHRNQALWNGEYGGEPIKIPTGSDDKVFAFYREKNGDKVLVAVNFSNEQVEITLKGEKIPGNYHDVLNDGTTTINDGEKVTLAPWESMVLSSV